jgi:hypothetical protein
MKPKMKKNPKYRGYGGGGDDDSSGIGFDKKNSHRKERRVFSAGNMSRYYKERVEPALRDEEKEELEYEQQQRNLRAESHDPYADDTE